MENATSPRASLLSMPAEGPPDARSPTARRRKRLPVYSRKERVIGLWLVLDNMVVSSWGRPTSLAYGSSAKPHQSTEQPKQLREESRAVLDGRLEDARTQQRASPPLGSGQWSGFRSPDGALRSFSRSTQPFAVGRIGPLVVSFHEIVVSLRSLVSRNRFMASSTARAAASVGSPSTNAAP